MSYTNAMLIFTVAFHILLIISSEDPSVCYMFGILAVHTLATYPEMNNPIKMEVGIEECLHIEFEYNKSKYHLKVDKLGQT